VTKENALTMVFNGTSSEGLAARYRDQLRDEDGYPEANLDIATLAEAEQRATSIVMYTKRNARSAARGVASALGIETVDSLDATTRQALASLPQSQRKDWNVVVIVGVDKSTQ
jgi:hypothetical protein